jgi:hypothetical protein
MHFYFNTLVFMNAMHLLRYSCNDRCFRHCEEGRIGSFLISHVLFIYY